MFDYYRETPDEGVFSAVDRFDPSWLDDASWPEDEPEDEPAPEEIGEAGFSAAVPSGWLALELDHGTVEPARLSDSELMDAVVGFDRVVSWAGARQAALLAELAAPERARP